MAGEGRCGATTVFWPDVECCEAECELARGHNPSDVHRDEILGEWCEDDMLTMPGPLPTHDLAWPESLDAMSIAAQTLGRDDFTYHWSVESGEPVRERVTVPAALGLMTCWDIHGHGPADGRWLVGSELHCFGLTISVLYRPRALV